MDVVVFGAGGRAGRRTVAEAVGRGHRVTAVVRDPLRHPELGATGVRVVAGDVTSAESVAAVTAGHDAAVSTVYDASADPAAFYTAATQALLEGLPRAGVRRLLVVGITPVLEVEPGVRVMDAPGFPEEFLEFCRGHAVEVDLLRAAETELDWLVVVPSTDFDHDGAGTGGYRLGGSRVPAEGTGRIAYPDFAVALVDELETPKHGREIVSVSPA